MTYLFIDTNIFLHCRHFDEIPWGSIVQGAWQLVLPPVVLDELDKHKQHKNTKIAHRAKAALKKIETISEGQLSYTLVILPHHPAAATLEQHHLDRQQQDDLLLASIIEFKAGHPTDTTLLVSNDTGPRLRGKHFQIGTMPLEDYLLPAEKSEEQKTIEQLTKELAQLKNSFPKLKVSFTDGSAVTEFKIPGSLITEEEFVRDQFPKETAEHQPMVYLDPNDFQPSDGRPLNSLQQAARIAARNPIRPNQVQVDRYNTALTAYQQEYKAYLAKKYQHIVLWGTSLKLELNLENIGNAPADDIDLYLHFPPNMIVLAATDMPTAPVPPTPPYRPKHAFDTNGETAFLRPRSSATETPHHAFPTMDITSPTIKKGEQYGVEFHFESLKHFQTEKTEAVFVLFTQRDQAANFSIGYTFHASNLPKPVHGKLNVRVVNADDEE